MLQVQTLHRAEHIARPLQVEMRTPATVVAQAFFGLLVAQISAPVKR